MVGFFQKFCRSFGAGLDAMIRRVENHEALVESAVHELEAALERAEWEQARSATVGEALVRELAEERDAVAQWRERAIREPVEARGLECLKRSKSSARRADELAERLAKHATVDERLATRSALFRRKLAEFREREAELKARQSPVEPLGASPGSATQAAELAELLERWEAQLHDVELARGPLPFSIEPENEEPRAAAEDAALLAELRALKEKTHEIP